MKKLISGILAAVMILSTANFMVVSANSVSLVDFNELTAGRQNTLPTDFVKAGADLEPNYYVEDGKFGKSDGDKALRVEQYWNNNERFRWYQARYNADKDTTGFNYLHFSTELAAKYGTADRWLGVGLKMQESKVAYPEFKFAVLDANGGEDRTITISFPGTEKTIIAPECSWMRFDLVMNTTTGISDIYYNGDLVVEDYQATYQGGSMTAAENVQCVTALFQAEFGINQLSTDGKSCLLNDTYIDNVVCEGVNDYPSIEKFVPYDETEFSSYTGGFADPFRLNLADDSCTTAEAVKGIFGKDSADTSMDIKTSCFREPNAKSPAQWQQVRYNNSAPEYADNKSKYWKISFNLAYNGNGMNRWIGLRYKMGNGSEQTSETEVTNIMSLNGGDNGVTMTVGGNSVNVAPADIGENKWMKFDIIINASVMGSASYDVYMNGNKLTKSSIGLTMPSDNKSWYSLSKITQIMIGVNHIWSEAEHSYPAADTYLDDISIRHYGALPVDISSSTESPRKIVMGRYDGFADLGAVRAKVENVTYNGEKCTLIKGSDTTGDSDLYLNYGSAPTSGIFTETISFVATDTVDMIYFATGGHTPISEKIPMSEFEPGTWNTLTIVVNRSTNNNAFYVNGEYHSGLTSAIKNNTLRIIAQKAQDKTINDIVLYADNYTIYTGTPDIPPISSEKLTLEAATLSGYADMTVGEVKESIVPVKEYYTVDIIDNGISVSDEAAAVKGMKLNVWDGDIFIMSYTMETADFKFGEPICYSNGYVDEKFTEGEYKYEIKAGSYSKPLSLMMIAAQYASDSGRLKKVTTKNYMLKGSQILDISIDIEKAEGTYLKFMIWDSNDNIPYVDAKTVYPYNDESVENVVRLFEGFTTKAFTMSYDDGVADDIEMIRILNKYGAKATFNLVGSTLLKNYAAYGSTEEEIYAAIKDTYKDHEIANHTYNHLAIFLNQGEIHTDSGGGTHEYVPLETAIKEITDNSALLKEKLGADVKGIAWSFKYPDNRNADELNQIQQAAIDVGIKYERYHENASFNVPEDWMRWSPTCHHSDEARYTKEFVKLKNEGDMKIYYVWGHSYEFKNNWSALENILKNVSSSNVWMATNGEIYEYITALDKVSVSGKTITNNSDKMAYLQVNGKQVRLAPGSVYEISDENTQKSIACWGDSLTWGQGASVETETYPAVLEKLTGSKVYNMGVGGETAYTIAARQGVYDIVLSEDVTIPAQGSVEIKLQTSEGGIVVPRSSDAGGWNPCTINGIEGQLKCEIDTNNWPRTVKKATFTRTGAGAAAEAKAGDEIIPYANSVKADVNIIFIGTNGGWDMNNKDVAPNDKDARASLIKIIKDMIKNTPNPDSFLVIGLTTNNDWSELSEDCTAEFGNKFLDIKNILASERALEEAGITPSADDISAINSGKIPPSLLISDQVHFNSSGYRLIANMVYDRINSLSYLYN